MRCWKAETKFFLEQQHGTFCGIIIFLSSLERNLQIYEQCFSNFNEYRVSGMLVKKILRFLTSPPTLRCNESEGGEPGSNSGADHLIQLLKFESLTFLLSRQLQKYANAVFSMLLAPSQIYQRHWEATTQTQTN